MDRCGYSSYKWLCNEVDDAYESISTESLLTFNKKFGVHGINAVLGMTYENSMWHSKWMAASNFPNDMTEDNVIEAGTKDRRMESSRGKSQLMSYLFRANYNLLDRYLFTFSMRRDGSSKLSELNRWNNFYSGAVAWRLSDESFVKQLNFFDDLKLRVSAGQTGGRGSVPMLPVPVLLFLTTVWVVHCRVVWQNPAGEDLQQLF